MKLVSKHWIIFAALSVVFLAIQATHFRYSISDENTYIYMAKAITEGQVPYKDFFYAHPPLHIYYLALFYLIFGLNILVLKATAVIPIVAAAGLIFWMLGKRQLWAEALLFTAIFYFAYDTMRFSTFAVWITLATFILVLAAVLAVEKKCTWAGAAAGFAGMAGFLSVAGAAAIGVYLFLADRKGAIRYMAAFAAVFIAANIALGLLLPGYFEDVLEYHLSKPGEGGNKGSVFVEMAKRNPLLFAAVALFVFSGRKARHAYLIPAAAALGLVGALILVAKVYGYYFLMALPFFAVLGAHGITSLISRVSEDRVRQALLVSIGIIAVSGAVSASYYYSNTYQDFYEAQQVADYVRANSGAGDAVFGDDSVTPLVAILAGRPVAPGYIDSNSLRWRSGLLGMNQTIREIEAGAARFVIVRRLNNGVGSFQFGPAYIDEFREFLKKCREALKINTSRGAEFQGSFFWHEFYVYDCINGQ